MGADEWQWPGGVAQGRRHIQREAIANLHARRSRVKYTHCVASTMERIPSAGNYQVSQQFCFPLFFSLSYSAAPLSRKPFKTHNNNENLKEIKDVRGPATEMIISPCELAPGGGPHHSLCWQQRCCHCLPLFHCHAIAIFIWEGRVSSTGRRPPLAPLSVTNGQVVNCESEPEKSSNTSTIYTFKIQIKSFACRHNE